MTRDDLQADAQWKSPRSAGHIKANPPGVVEEVTGFALGACHERARIETLTILNGLGWPTASVILHFFHEDRYPILDFRALESLSFDVSSDSVYCLDLWWKYVRYTRKLAERSGLDMRDLDRALWQYSKEKGA